MRRKVVYYDGYVVTDRAKACNALAELIRYIPERGNLRFIRHITHLKMKLKGRGSGVYTLTDKQVNTLEFALSRS